MNCCKTTVDFRISCKCLRNRDTLSNSDPCVQVQLKTKKGWEEVGRTERVVNCLDPVFNTTIKLDYYFEEVQHLRFNVYDVDNERASFRENDFLGQLKCHFGEIVSFDGAYTSCLTDKNGKSLKHSTITIIGDESDDFKEMLQVQMYGENLDNKDFFGRSDPFLEFWYNDKKSDKALLLYRTEVIKNTLNPEWKSFKMALSKLQLPVLVKCWDWDSDGGHDLIGEFTTCAKELEVSGSYGKPLTFKLIHPKKKSHKKHYKHSGLIFVKSCRRIIEYSFLDYIMGGCQLNFTVGIDFTGSNGEQTSPMSLHYMSPYQPTQYAQAIQAVGQIVQDYDADKLFPVFGFGAITPSSAGQVSHEFPINFNSNNPYCKNIDGVLQAYQQCLAQIKFWGPTNVSPIINHVAQFAMEASRIDKFAANYFILLLLTDGVITDMQASINAIVHASKLPMSVIIIGIGNADFSDMEMLDGDGQGLRDKSGQKSFRDIVQFVPMKKLANSSSEELAKCVLAEIPEQVSGYFRMKGIDPIVKPGLANNNPGHPS